MQSVKIKGIDNNDFDIWPPLWKGCQRFCESPLVDVGVPTARRGLSSDLCTRRLHFAIHFRWHSPIVETTILWRRSS